jgi:peptide deformylase
MRLDGSWEPVRIAVIEVDHNPRYPYKPPIPLTIVVNPVLEPLDDELVEINEGCLSVPDLRGDVFRHVNVRVRYLDRAGGKHAEVKRGLTAGTFQHECDHLDGMLFLDRVRDTRTLSTWEQFERYRRDEFITRITEFVRRGLVTTYHCELAWLGGPTTVPDVLIEVTGDRISRGEASATPRGVTHLAGLTMPGLANTHRHAFHRVLRGRTQAGGGTFWTWREQMYAAAAWLTPDNYHRLARATFGEMALAGITAVGEFHYLHHGPAARRTPTRTPWARPSSAAGDAGVRITLLDTCYLAGGIGVEPNETQRRFSDGDPSPGETGLSATAPRSHRAAGAAVHFGARGRS